MKLKQLLLFTLCIAFFACSSDSSDDSGEENQNNTDNILLKKTIETYDEGYIITTNFTYSGNKLVNKTDGTFKYDYLYQDDLLVRVNSFVNGEMDAYTIFEFDDNNEIISSTLNIIDDSMHKEIFIQNSDNTITIEEYSSFDGSQMDLNDSYDIVNSGESIIKQINAHQSLYDYDNKNGTFKNVIAIDLLNYLARDFGAIEANVNNVIKYDESKINNSTDDIIVETYQYEYNEKDFPISSKYQFIYEGEVDEESTIEYFYE